MAATELEELKEVLGLTKESLMVWLGFTICTAGFFILTAQRTIDSLLIGEGLLLVGIVLASAGVIRDFRKEHLKVMHLVGNLMVIAFLLIFVLIFVANALSLVT